MVDFNNKNDSEDHIGPEVRDLMAQGDVQVEEFAALRMNSWERDALIPYMSDSLLARQALYTLHNCERRRIPATTYEEALQLYVQELVVRLRDIRPPKRNPNPAPEPFQFVRDMVTRMSPRNLELMELQGLRKGLKQAMEIAHKHLEQYDDGASVIYEEIRALAKKIET